MQLAIKSTVYRNIVILELYGILRFVDFSLRNKVSELLEMGHREIVLDLSNVSFMDAFGLGQLVSIRTAIHNAGGHMTLLRPTDSVRSLLNITKLDSVIPIVDDAEEPHFYFLGDLSYLDDPPESKKTTTRLVRNGPFKRSEG